MPPFYFIHILYAYMTPILNNHTLFSKNKKAKQLGVEIVTEEVFLERWCKDIEQ